MNKRINRQVAVKQAPFSVFSNFLHSQTFMFDTVVWYRRHLTWKNRCNLSNSKISPDSEKKKRFKYFWKYLQKNLTINIEYICFFNFFKIFGNLIVIIIIMSNKINSRNLYNSDNDTIKRIVRNRSVLNKGKEARGTKLFWHLDICFTVRTRLDWRVAASHKTRLW